MTTEPNRTFGVEIEAKGISRYDACGAIRRAGIDCEIEGYNHHTGSYWKVTSDVSVSGGWEVVSPILRGADGIEQVRKVCDALQTAGARVERDCGFHVHVGAAEFTTGELRTIAKNYVVFEHFFDAIMPPSRRGNSNDYIKSNRGLFGGYDYDATARAMAALSAARTRKAVIMTAMHSHHCSGCANGLPHRCNFRYRKLNLTAWYQHGTIEFRQHAGTIDGEKATAWIRLLIQFVNRAKVTRQRPSRKEHSMGSTFRAFFRCFAIDKAGDDLRPYFERRRRAFHGM